MMRMAPVAMSCLRWLVQWRAAMAAAYRTQYQHYTRQQTTTVDYKRLFNGLVLTKVASLQHNYKNIENG